MMTKFEQWLADEDPDLYAALARVHVGPAYQLLTSHAANAQRRGVQDFFRVISVSQACQHSRAINQQMLLHVYHEDERCRIMQAVLVGTTKKPGLMRRFLHREPITAEDRRRYLDLLDRFGRLGTPLDRR